MDKKITINIFIAIYNYFGDINRYNLTKIILKHYSNIKNKFENKADISFTIIGSEKEYSKNLTLNYFKNDEYFEYDQDVKLDINQCNRNFIGMLNAKINFGINMAMRDEPDIILWAGSNDYISFDFFEQIINFYDSNEKQIYGIDNYLNGNNASFLCVYDGITNFLDIHNKDEAFWWNGIHIEARKHYNYIGGIIGINKKIYKENPEILKIWNCDEGQVEHIILKINNIKKFNSKEVFFFNIKTSSNNDLNKLSSLKNLFCKNIIKFNDFNNDLKKKINDEMSYLLNLISNINKTF
jgi:hypothetical protein